MKKIGPLPRRTFLKGLGTAMALPWLEAMIPTSSTAEYSVASPPVRMAFIFFPNGAIPKTWNPSGDEQDWQLSPTLEPLQDHQSQINVFAGLTQHHGRANGDGAGDHARCAGSYLTGAQPFKTAGADIKLGVSVDQAAAKLIGQQTKLSSLELGIEPGRNGGNCDSGYSCAYSSNISWKTETSPMTKEVNPKLAFERLFGSSESSRGRAKRDFFRRSILDMVAEDAVLLKRRLGKKDQRKMDEYFSGVRELERRIERSDDASRDLPDYPIPQGVPAKVEDHIRLMYDIMALAFQTDTTRICSFMSANAGSNRSYRMVGVNGGHHSLSHHRNDKQKVEDISKIDKFLVTQFAYFLDKLKSIKEGEKTLLDNSLVLYGSGISDANRHDHHDLPIVLAGTGGGKIKTGALKTYPNNTPLNNLFVSMCQVAGADVETLGDSTGRLRDIEV